MRDEISAHLIGRAITPECFIAANVLMLKKTVPTSCTVAASQSIRRGSQDTGRQWRRFRPRRLCSTLTVSVY